MVVSLTCAIISDMEPRPYLMQAPRSLRNGFITLHQMNLSATLSVFKLFRDPALCLPHSTVSTFNHIPIPLSKAFVNQHGGKDIDIRAVILDKDNCFAKPKENVVHKPYSVQISALLFAQLLLLFFARVRGPYGTTWRSTCSRQIIPSVNHVVRNAFIKIGSSILIISLLQDKFAELRKAYPGSRLLIVSNSAGTSSDPGGKEADLLESNTGVKVLRHSTKKPGCRTEIFHYFRNSPELGVTRPEQIAVVGDRLFTDVMMANMMGSYGIWIKEGVVEEKGLVSALSNLSWCEGEEELICC